MVSVLLQLNEDMAKLVENGSPSLVEVSTGKGGSGAGTVWHSDGLIVTNAHVAQNQPLTVSLEDGRTLEARLLALDAALDLAALAVDSRGLPAVEIGNSRDLHPGQWVFSLGHPWHVRGAAAAGVVIGMGTEWQRASARELIAVNLPLRPGNSGGPLLDAQGRLVGINTMITGPEVGLAVPVHVAKAFLRDNLGARVAVA